MKQIYLQYFIFQIALSVALGASASQELAMLQQETSLEAALTKLQEQSGISIVYEPSLIQDIQVDPIILESGINAPAILKKLLPSNLTLEKLDTDSYAIIKKPVTSTYQINTTVSGIVEDESGEPIPGVTVLEKGTSNGVVTNFEGLYSLDVTTENPTLVYSFIGYQPQEITLGGRTMVNVILQEDIQQLTEVVITAIGLESEKRTLGYSVQNIDTEDILNSREANLSSALSAKAAGVQVISASGSPGASATVRIRGNRSATGTNEPLYVIDGVPVDNNTSGNGIIGVDVSNRAIDINPNDIEKITILKGPSATVLYGSRAANGAIMINTKRGQKGSPVVTINSAYSTSEVNKLPPKQYQYAQGSPKTGQWQYFGPETGESLSWGPLISSLEYDGDETYLYDKNGRLVPSGTGNGIPAQAYNDYDAFWVNGQTFDNNISVNGGTDAVRYYFSIGNLYQTGIVPNADFQRISIKSNIDASITDKLRAGVSATYINSGGYRAQRGSNLSGVTTGVFRNPPTFDIGNGKTGHEAADDPATYSFPNGDQRSYRGNGLYDNPFWSVNRNPFEDNVDRVIGNMNVSYDLFDWLKASYKIGMDQYTDRRVQAWDINSSSEPEGRVDQTTLFQESLNSDFLLLLNKDFGAIGIDATLGHNYYSSSRFARVDEGYIMAEQGFYSINNTTEVLSSENYLSRTKFFGAYADTRFNFKELVFLSLSARNDWSSTLPRQNNSFFYPAASIGLEVSELFGFSNFEPVPYVKLRASWGQVGSGGSSFRTDNYFDKAIIDGDGLLSSNEFPAFGVTAFEREQLLANKELEPELTTTIEVGGDFQFAGGRVDLDFTYYNAFTNNQIVQTDISGATGFSSITLNSGELENKGIEIQLGAKLLQTSKINWKMNVNFTRNRSLIKSLPENVESIRLAEFTAISSMILEGQPYGVFSGTRYRRNDQGNLIIGSDGWPLIDASQGIIGDPNPDWLLGVGNSIDLYGVSLSFLWDIRSGGDVWNGTKAVMDYLGVSKESGDLRDVTGYIYDGVTVTGEPNTTPVDFANPAFGLSGIKWRRAGTLLGVAEDNIEDASWIRLREVTLGYSLPSDWFKQVRGVSDISISVYGRNLLLITEYKGVDPETNLRGPSNAQGWDYFNLPGTRSYGVSLKAVLK